MEAASPQEQNLALVRAAIDAYNRGDLDYVLERLDPAIEVHTAPGLINAGTYHGIDGFLAWVSQWSEAWESFHNEIVRIEPVGEHFVIAEVLQQARGAGSGVEVRMEIAYLFESHDGRATRFHLYPDWGTALAVVERLGREADPGERAQPGGR